MYSPEEIGKYLRELRIKAGVSQEAVAKAIGVSREAYSMYERGIRNPSDDTKISIAKYFHKSVGSIFFRKAGT